MSLNVHRLSFTVYAFVWPGLFRLYFNGSDVVCGDSGNSDVVFSLPLMVHLFSVWIENWQIASLFYHTCQSKRDYDKKERKNLQSSPESEKAER